MKFNLESTKTLKLNFRCVYKFGVKACDWAPLPGETVSGGGKRFFPNPATWPVSRFYKEFENFSPMRNQMTSHAGSSLDSPPVPRQTSPPGVTTLFTLKPLDNTATSFSEMEVMSDNTRILKTKSPDNDIITSQKVTENSISTHLQKDSNPEVEVIDDEKGDEKFNSGMLEINCKLLLPQEETEKVLLELETGQRFHLDRRLFSNIDLSQLSPASPVPKIKTTIIHKDKSLRRKKRAFVRHNPVSEGPITQTQLMDAVIPKESHQMPNFLNSYH